ncbi:hypothetical protein GCM10007242_41240 [Pigmentiphaga litoralis]|nr:hypothetical protein GCM10007242_41240 [Pigmentiphaga litoralis]
MPVIATLDGADEQGISAARNGGVLRLEGGVVHALAGAPRRRIGHVWSSEIVSHLAAGGQAYFRSDDGYQARQIVCGLVQ